MVCGTYQTWIPQNLKHGLIGLLTDSHSKVMYSSILSSLDFCHWHFVIENVLCDSWASKSQGQGPLWWFMSDNTNQPSKTLSFRTSPNSEDYIFLSVQCMLKVHHASFQSSNGSFGDMEGVKTKLLSFIALRVVLAHSVRGTKSRDLGSTSWTPLGWSKFFPWFILDHVLKSLKIVMTKSFYLH